MLDLDSQRCLQPILLTKQVLVPGWDYARVEFVRVIALSTIKTFLNRGQGVSDAHEPVMAWFRQVRQADWARPADLKRDIRSAIS